MSNDRKRKFGAIATVLRLAVQRQRARPLRGALVSLGVAAATATVLGVFGGGLIASDLRVRSALDSVSDAERSVRFLWRGTSPTDGLAPLDRQVAAPVAELTSGPVARSVQLRELNLGGRGVVLTAVDEASRWLDVVTGSLPGPCRPERCEVVQVAGAETPVPGVDGARVVVVGTARLRSNLPFGDLVGSRSAQGSFSDTPVLVAGDREGLSALPGVSFAYRTYTWSAAVSQRQAHPWSIDALLGRQARLGQQLAAADGGFGLTAPEGALVDARDASRRAASRIQLIGGVAAALVLGFALLAAVALRDEHAEERDRLARRGAGRGMRALFTIAERAWMALVGVVIGSGVAIAAVWLIAWRADVDAGEVLRQSLLSASGLARVGLVWLATTVILVIAQRPLPDTPTGRVHLVDVAAVGGLAAIALAAARGSADADRLSGRDGDPLLMVLPVAAAVVAGIVIARLFGPLMRLIERRARRAPMSTRLALVALARRPGRSALTAAFLVMGLGLAVFAQTYRATLQRGNTDQATFVVPRDLTITQGSRSRPPVAADVDLPPAGTAESILRQSVSIRGASLPQSATLLGVPASRLGDGWRGDFSDTSAEELTRRLAPVADARLTGVDLPAAATSVRFPARQISGPAVDVRLVVQTADGATEALVLAPTGNGTLAGRIGGSVRGGRIVGIEAVLTPAQQINVGHSEGEGRGSDSVVGTMALGPLVAEPGGATVADWSGWDGQGAMAIVARNGPTIDVRYVLGREKRALFRAAQAWDTGPLPVLVSDDLARQTGVGNDITFTVGGVDVTGRVVADSRQFPTVADGPFVVADVGRLSRQLHLASPGAGTTNELWVSGGGSNLRSVRDSAERDRLVVVARRDVAQRLAADPLGRGVLATLLAAALIAVALGVVALALAMVSDLRDERRHTADLSLQGVPAATIRSHMWQRGALVVAVGIGGGLILGTILSTLVVRLVRVAADTRTPVPPLAYAAGWPTIVTGLLAFAFIATGAVALVTRGPVASRSPLSRPS